MDRQNQRDGRRYLYGKADEKFVKPVMARKKRKTGMPPCKFKMNAQVRGFTTAKAFNKTDVPIVFKCSPDTLVNLCVRVLDAMPLPEVYDWSIEKICQWLRDSGFKQYQNTFRCNLITGRKLLLLDAAALSDMNIKDLAHIKRITQGIRNLFYYTMPKFGRCISLHPEFHNNLYKLVRLRTGAKYSLRRSDVWRKVMLMPQKEPNCTHWETLDRWLAYDKQPAFKQLIGGVRRSNLYACKAKLHKDPIAEAQCSYHCSCIPPCECFSWDLSHRRPWRLQCLPHLKAEQEFVAACGSCTPPCCCRWPSTFYRIYDVLSCLKKSLPNKYDYNFGLRHARKSDQICFSFSPKC